MRTYSLVKGLPVFDLRNGSKLGEVCDLCISSNGKVEGLLLKKKTMFHKMNRIEIENVVSFGTDGVMVSQPQVLEPLVEPPDFTIEHQHKLTGKMVMSAEGEKLGLVEDVYFLEELGTIVGYECTDGFFSDIKEGKRVVKTVQPPAIGKDTIIVNVDHE
ncbi:MAG: PRC-barrel domain-containing protein [Bacillus sp. (in: firmicutes)]